MQLLSSLAAFTMISLSLTVDDLIIMCLGLTLFEFNLLRIFFGPLGFGCLFLSPSLGNLQPLLL